MGVYAVDLDPHTFVHHTAQLGDGVVLKRGVELAEGVLLGPRCVVHRNTFLGPHVQVGAETVIYHSSEILPEVSIGAHCIIGSCCFLGARCQIGEGSRLHHSVGLPADTVIGTQCYIGVHVVCTDIRYVDLADPSREAHKPPVIQDRAVIGCNVVLLPGVVIGEGAIVGAGAVVTHDVKPYTIVVGNPARRLYTPQQSFG